jgi:hypothetical protein
MSVANSDDTGAEAGATVEADPVETVELPSTEHDNDDTPADKGTEPRENHKERRSNRMRAEKEAREAAERQTAELREALEQTRRETAELRGWAAAQAQRGQGDPEAASKERVTALRREANNHLVLSAQLRTAGDLDGAQREMDAYHDKIADAVEERRAPRREAEMSRLREEVQGAIPSAETMAVRDRIGREFPDLYTNADLRNLAQSKIESATQSGKRWSYEVVKAAVADAAKLLRIGGRQAPTEQTRQRFQAVGSGEGAGGGGESVQVPFGPKERQLAHAAFPKDEPADAKRKWLSAMAKSKKEGGW